MPFTLPHAADPIGTFDATAAWFSLSQVQRDLIGTLAIRFAFGGLVSEDVFAKEDRLLSREANDQGLNYEDVAMGALMKSVGDALPAVFGANGEDPAWILGSQPDETDEQFLDRVVVQPLAKVVTPGAEKRMAALLQEQDAMPLLRPAPFTAPSDDRRADGDIVRGLRGVLAPASILQEA